MRNLTALQPLFVEFLSSARASEQGSHCDQVGVRILESAHSLSRIDGYSSEPNTVNPIIFKSFKVSYF